MPNEALGRSDAVVIDEPSAFFLGFNELFSRQQKDVENALFVDALQTPGLSKSIC